MDWAGIFFNGLAEVDLWLLGLWALAVVTVLGSAFASATIAEMRSRGMFIHFCGGLVLPWIYPLLIGMRLTVSPEAEQEKREELETENRLGVKMAFLRVQFEQDNKKRKRQGEPEILFREWLAAYEAAKETAAIEAERRERDVVAPTSGVNRLFLENLAVDSEGSRKGPFTVKLVDGRTLRVEQIKNIMEDVAAFEIIDTVTRKPKSIRVKYGNIVLFQSVEQ